MQCLFIFNIKLIGVIVEQLLLYIKLEHYQKFIFSTTCKEEILYKLIKTCYYIYL